jgi:hypothetical protein
MPSKKNDDHKLADRATELYWRSGESVNKIAEAMDLSKSGLYTLIRPLPAERPCPECGEGLVFPNRTARQKDVGSCFECEYEDGVQPAAKSADRASPKREASTKRPGTRNGPGAVQESKPRGRRSSRVLWGALLLGVAAGLYATRRSR